MNSDKISKNGGISMAWRLTYYKINKNNNDIKTTNPKENERKENSVIKHDMPTGKQ